LAPRYTPGRQTLALITGADADGDALLASQAEDPALSRALQRWRCRLGQVPSSARLAAWLETGMRLIMPGEPEWPTQLDDLGHARPLVLWLQGSGDLKLACLNSVSIVGARAATGYGSHVAIEMAAYLAEEGVTVVSGGA
jgi:DNA processing protein